MSVRRSVVKWFDAKKGYGFIVHPEGGSDIFIHYSQIISDEDFKTLRTGQVVEFELHHGPKGPHAKEAKVIDTEEESSQEAESATAEASSPSPAEVSEEKEEVEQFASSPQYREDGEASEPSAYPAEVEENEVAENRDAPSL